MFTTTASRKVLVPLATLLAAGAVAIGSGATWTSSTDTSLSVSGGDLLHTNNHNGVTLNLDALKPGDSMSGTLTVENTGDVDSMLYVTETASANTFGLDEATADPTTDTDLKLTITAEGMDTPLYDGDFGAWVNDEQRYVTVGATTDKTQLAAPDASTSTAGGSIDITFTVELIDTADNDSQEATASASYDFVTVPVDGETGLQGVWDDLTGSTDSTDGTP